MELSYYQRHKKERALYAKNYYALKKNSTEIAKKPRKSYKTWKNQSETINEFKKYIAENQITTYTLSFK